MSKNADCPSEQIADMLELAGRAPEIALNEIEGVMCRVPNGRPVTISPRVAACRREKYETAKLALYEALRIAPDYELARFQLGFLNITSGETAEAKDVWVGLSTLVDGHPLRLFARGLTALANDDFEVAKSCLAQGISCNLEVPFLNRDMQVILEQITKSQSASGKI